MTTLVGEATLRDEARRPDAVILLGRGGYGDWPQQELDRMAAAVRQTGRYRMVLHAFLDLGAPSLPEALQAARDAGARRILVAPVFVPVDRTLRLWLPKIVRRWLRRQRDRDVEVVLARALGDHDGLGQVVAQAVAEAEQDDDVRVNAPVDRGDPGWSVIPPYRHHVFFCAGPRCTTTGSDALWQHLRDQLTERGMARGPGAVRVVRSGCLYPCNLGPVMVVYPEGTWYCALTPAVLDRIIGEHFAGGQVVAAYTRTPGPRPHTRPAGDSPTP